MTISCHSPSKVKKKENYFCRKPMKAPPKRRTRAACKSTQSKTLFSPPMLQEKEESIENSVRWEEQSIKKNRSVRFPQPVNLGIDMLEKPSFPESDVDLKKLNSFKASKVEVDGVIVDSEIPDHVRNKYYELCCTQKCYLHENVQARLNLKFIAGMISETVNLADRIRAAELNTSFDKLVTWDMMLKCFEVFGMRVGFLRDRVRKLVEISCEPRKKMETKRLKRLGLEKEVRRIELRVLDVEGEMKRLDDEMGALEFEGKEFELSFIEAASAPW